MSIWLKAIFIIGGTLFIHGMLAKMSVIASGTDPVIYNWFSIGQLGELVCMAGIVMIMCGWIFGIYKLMRGDSKKHE